MAKFLDYFSILILFAIVALSPWPYGSVRLDAQYFIFLASSLILIIWLVNKNIYSEEIACYSPYLPLSIFFTLALVSIAFSVYRYASILASLNLLSYVALFFLVTQVFSNEKRVNIFIWLILLAGFFYCSYGILQYYGYLPRGFWEQQNSLASRFVNSGPFGAFININIFLCLGAIFLHKNFFAKIIAILFLAVFTVAFALCNSRISWATFILSFIFFLFLLLKYSRSLKIKNLFIFNVFLVIVIAYIIWHFRHLIWQRIDSLPKMQFQSLLQRLDIWRGTLRIILNYPFGSGIGTFPYIYPAYRTHSDRFFVDNAHSDYLQIASELGIIGILVFIWFILGLFKQGIKALSNYNRKNFFVVLGLCCALLSFSIQSLVDFALQLPANAILFFILAGLLARFNDADKPPRTLLLNEAPQAISLRGLLERNTQAAQLFILALSFASLRMVRRNGERSEPKGKDFWPRMYKYGNLAYVTLILVSFISFTNIFLANKYYALAEGNSSKLQWQQAISDYDKSIKFMPLRADGHAAKGSVYALRATLALGAQKEEFRKNAILNFLKAVKLNSSQSIYYLNLAWLYVDERRDADAIYAFKKAIDKKPTEGLFYFPYADYCLEHGLFDEALANYRKGLSLFVDENWLRTFYGSEYDGVFEKIYNTTKDYNLLKKVVPDNLSICFNFARFLEKKQMLDEAYLEYKTILTKYPENTAVQQAIKGLKKE